jgi:hypothetical protein
MFIYSWLFVRCYVYNKHKPNLCTSLTRENRTENNFVSHAQNTTALQPNGLFTFNTEVTDHQKRDLLLFPPETTAKFICKFLSQYSYVLSKEND